VIFESPTISTGLISITDIFGRLVAEVSVKELKTVWDTKGIKPGVYLYHLNNGMQMTSGKIMIIK
ncbi:MAG: T9SS type A sorting domain-containing protein, partial [Lentimicrobium sp.]|nr:T9SS type A sorting domain-containing protein [Lentimicrobium sp.]